MRSIFIVVVFLFAGPVMSSGQTGVMSGLEKELLKLLAKDSVSTLVSYMPVGRSFGINGLSHEDQLVIVKIGKQVDLVSRETGFIFGCPMPGGPLVRLDSNNVFGAEYRVDPFVRKDTLFMIATSRFLKGKGFLAYFDPAIHEWKAYRGNDEVIKESTRPYYDPVRDQLYLVCNYMYDEAVDSAKESMDNVLRFTFATGKWELVGRLDTDVYSSAMQIPVEFNWLTGFGAGNLEAGDLNVVQPDKNRWLSTDSSFRVRMFRTMPSMADTAKIRQLIHMGDTLYAFAGTEDSVWVERMAVVPDDFTVSGGNALYEAPVPGQDGNALPGWAYAMIGALVLGGVLLVYRRVGRGKTSNAVAENGEASSINGPSASMLAAAPATKKPVTYFLESLTSVERSLVLELSRYALRDEIMQTQALNQILGVSQKEPEVQKVRRSLTITRINSNFVQMLAPEEALIRREKDPADKRVFLYYVTKVHATLLLEAEPRHDHKD